MDRERGVLDDGLLPVGELRLHPHVEEGLNFLDGLKTKLVAAFDSSPDPFSVDAGTVKNLTTAALRAALGTLLLGDPVVDVRCGGATCADSAPASDITEVRIALDIGVGETTPGGCAA